MNKDEVIYDLVKEVREETKEIRQEMSVMNQTLHINTLSLQEHIEGVKTLKALHIQNAARIEGLEEERKANIAKKKFQKELRTKIVKGIAVATTIIGFVTAIIKYLNA